ncbi:MAG: NAD(+)/NADH kinase [Lachnospiraceae bacterium]|nr:NAD(+)/NADH kinase [Lachnospiraceae bacterium]
MKRFFIITNEHRDEDLAVTRSVQDYIAKHGGESSYYVSNKTEWKNRSLHSLAADGINADCILVLGGDGTLVRAAREMAKIGVPLIGVNLGTIGYLCELDLDQVFPAIDCLLKDQYEVENRMMIQGSVPGEEDGEPTLALNDIVIHRVGSAQLINLELTVNGEYLATYSADGIILSTPTGSTGYSMASRGPIVDPKTELILITPINPQSFSARSIVVGADAQIEVTLAKRRVEEDEEAEVAFDGDRFSYLKVGDKIRVQKADVSAKILRLDRLSFLQILRKKMT